MFSNPNCNLFCLYVVFVFCFYQIRTTFKSRYGMLHFKIKGYYIICTSSLKQGITLFTHSAHFYNWL